MVACDITSYGYENLLIDQKEKEVRQILCILLFPLF